MFECVINVSEGRDLDVLERFSRAAGSSLRDVHHDPFHHRSVFTLINSGPELIDDVHALVAAVVSSLDLARHVGVHPRLGVLDVVPFVALPPETDAAARELRDVTARWIASTYEIPVFLYGLLEDGERTLPYVRAHAFKDLAPDVGPARPDAHRGAVVVGARPLLVAWNLWLRDVPLDQARDMARRLRRPGVRALGLRVGDLVQVSCNLVDVSLARPSEVYDEVAAMLTAPGVIDHAELVGLVPRALLQREDPHRWAELGLSEEATIESRVAGV